MIRVTIAEPALQAPNLTTPTAPIWHDADGMGYRVASGFREHAPEGAWEFNIYDPSEPPQATPDIVSVITGMDGRAALHAIGLRQPDT